MKSITIITIKEFSDDVRKLINKQKTKVFIMNEGSVIKNSYNHDDSENWFGDDHYPIASDVFKIFADDEVAKNILSELAILISKKEQADAIMAFETEVISCLK